MNSLSESSRPPTLRPYSICNKISFAPPPPILRTARHNMYLPLPTIYGFTHGCTAAAAVNYSLSFGVRAHISGSSGRGINDDGLKPTKDISFQTNIHVSAQPMQYSCPSSDVGGLVGLSRRVRGWNEGAEMA